MEAGNYADRSILANRYPRNCFPWDDLELGVLDFILNHRAWEVRREGNLGSLVVIESCKCRLLVTFLFSGLLSQLVT